MRNAIRGITLIVSSLALGTLNSIPSLAETYQIENALVTLMPDPFHAGAESEARDININRQIVGWANTSAGVENAFLYEPAGVYKNVGIPLLTTPALAEGINNHGEVVGYWRNGNSWRGFYWHASAGFSSLGIELRPGFVDNDKYYFAANAINDFGLIVGIAMPGDVGFGIPFDTCLLNIAIYWSRPHSEPRILYCPNQSNGESTARAVSNYGWIAGFEVGNDVRAYRYSDGAVTYVPNGVSGTIMATAEGVNEKGAVVGRGGSAGIAPRAVYWDGTSSSGSISLGVLPGGDLSEANDVNYQAFVAGFSERGRMTQTGMVITGHAFLWHESFGMYELPSPAAGRGAPWSKCEANALHNLNLAPNSAGVITLVGYCERSEKKRATRWEVTVRRTS